MTKVCRNCDTPLIGRQRRFCSNRCTKAYGYKSAKVCQKSGELVRKSEYSKGDSASNEQNNGILDNFLADLAHLDPFLKLELVKNFSRIIDHQDLWTKRSMAHEKGFPVGSRMSDVHILTANILQTIRDELTEVLQ